MLQVQRGSLPFSVQHTTTSPAAQVLRWMANPVPASQYRLSCPTPSDMTFPGGHFCLAPSGGCVQVSRVDMGFSACCACSVVLQAALQCFL